MMGATRSVSTRIASESGKFRGSLVSLHFSQQKMVGLNEGSEPGQKRGSIRVIYPMKKVETLNSQQAIFASSGAGATPQGNYFCKSRISDGGSMSALPLELDDRIVDDTHRCPKSGDCTVGAAHSADHCPVSR
jgi:hypothetical protein